MPEMFMLKKPRWAVSLYITIPPMSLNVIPIGQAGIIEEKILIFMQLPAIYELLNMNLTLSNKAPSLGHG